MTPRDGTSDHDENETADPTGGRGRVRTCDRSGVKRVVTPPRAAYQQQQHQIFPHKPQNQQGSTTFRVMSGVMKT
jgi:hypothetical protein